MAGCAVLLVKTQAGDGLRRAVAAQSEDSRSQGNRGLEESLYQGTSPSFGRLAGDGEGSYSRCLLARRSEREGMSATSSCQARSRAAGQARRSSWGAIAFGPFCFCRVAVTTLDCVHPIADKSTRQCQPGRSPQATSRTTAPDRENRAVAWPARRRRYRGAALGCEIATC